MQKVFQIALGTFRETIRSRILYTVLFFAVLVVLATSLFGSVTIGDQAKVIKDFGLTSIAVFALAMAVLSGSALLFKELHRKTIYNILAKPVARWEFLLGKHLGLMASVLLMMIFLTVSLALYASLFESRMDSLIFVGGAYIILEMVILVAASIFFSSIVVTPLLSGLFTFSLFLAGRSSNFIFEWAGAASSEFLKKGMLTMYWVLPHLGALNLSNDLVYGRVPTLEFFLLSLCYSVGYAGILLLLANLFFTRREFN